MIQVMLMVHTTVTPFLASHLVENTWFAVALTLLVTTSLWSLLYIAREIDHPFGEDANDFDMDNMQQAMNKGLLTLLHPMAQKLPTQVEGHKLALVKSDVHISGVHKARHDDDESVVIQTSETS